MPRVIWPEPPPDKLRTPEATGEPADGVNREVVRNFVKLPTAPAAPQEVVIATSENGYPNCEVWVDPKLDMGLVNATLRLYAWSKEIRILVATFVLTSVASAQRVIAVSGIGAERWEASVQLAAFANPQQQVPFVLVTYGTSSNAQIAGLASGVGAAYSLLQTDPTGTFGQWNASPTVGPGNYIAWGVASGQPATGLARFPGGTTKQIVFRSNSNTVDLVFAQTNNLDQLTIWDATNGGAVSILSATNIILRSAAFFSENAAGSVDMLEVDATAIHGAVPFAGSSISGKAPAFLEATIAMGDANQTPAAAVYQAPNLILTGAATADHDLVLPATPGAVFIIDNQCTGAFNVNVRTSAGTSAVVPNGKIAIVKLNSAHNGYRLVTTPI